jgi:hypothetical protein
MLVRGIAMEKARDDLGAAWTWLQQHGGAAPESQAHAADLLYRWSYARPQEVARLLPALAPSPLQSHLAVRLALQMACTAARKPSPFEYVTHLW